MAILVEEKRSGRPQATIRICGDVHTGVVFPDGGTDPIYAQWRERTRRSPFQSRTYPVATVGGVILRPRPAGEK